MTEKNEIDGIREVLKLRKLLDGFAARYAALQVSRGASGEHLREILRDMGHAAKQNDFNAFAEADKTFHLAICRLANVLGLTETWQTCRHYWDSFRVETIQSCYPDLTVLLDAHRPIVDMICEGHPAAAEVAAQSHLDPVWYRLEETHQASALRKDPFERACAYLAFHLNESIALQSLAQTVELSEGHLARLFRDHRGQSFTQYLRNLRMNHAAQLLRETNLAVGEIARAVGYKDASRFSRHFRYHHGSSPRSYRRVRERGD